MEAASVILTCYNLERFIGAAIESVLAQDFVPRPQIIAVDDCSTDQSEQVIRSYPEVRYVRTDRNSGSLLAMLAGLEEASGDIVCLLDGDDLWNVNKIRRVSDCFAHDPCIALVTHDLRFMNGSGQPIDRLSRPAEVLGAAPVDERSERIRKGILMHGDFVWLGSALSFRRSVGRVDEFAEWARSLPDPSNTYQDWPLAFWIAALPSVEFGYVPEKLFGYRLHDLNHSGDASTPSNALRNFRRSYNTVAAMQQIASMRGLSPVIESELNERLRFLSYLVDLYSGRSCRAASSWVYSLRYMFRRKLLLKEFARFLAILLLGRSRFSSLAAKKGRSGKSYQSVDH